MTASIDNSKGAIPNVIRDASTCVQMKVNADGSINTSATGVKSIAAGTAATVNDWIPGTIRDPVSGTTLKVNADGSINTAAA
jgi:hypothetical protein